MWAVVLAVAAGLCWGIGEVAAKAVLHSGKIGPFLAVAIRTSIALPFIWIAFAAAKRIAPDSAGRGIVAMDSKGWSQLVIGSSLIAGAAAMIAFYAALSLGEVSRIKPIAFSVAPATGVLLGWLMLGEPMTVRKAVGVCVILIGVVILSTGTTPQHA